MKSKSIKKCHQIIMYTYSRKINLLIPDIEVLHISKKTSNIMLNNTKCVLILKTSRDLILYMRK